MKMQAAREGMRRTNQPKPAIQRFRKRALRQVCQQHEVSAASQLQLNFAEQPFVVRSRRQRLQAEQAIAKPVKLSLPASGA
jgi:hypothetical protein